jgi:hypothetical protein
MKKHSTKSGKATHASPQPQQITAKVQPTPEQIEKAMLSMIEGRMEQFAVTLSIARQMYKRDRKLVTSPRFPKLYADWYKRSTGEAIGETGVEKAPTEASIRKESMRTALVIAKGWVARARFKSSPDAANLINESGAVADPPTTTYRLLAQRFEDGKEIEFLQEVELTYDENWKLRRYLAELRGLIPQESAA